MKKKIAISVILIISVVLAAAIIKGKPTTNNHIPKSDTIKTLMLYYSNEIKDLKYDIGYRILRDTFKYLPVSSTTAKKKWLKDTFYFVPVPVPLLDSLKKPVLDSLRKPVYSAKV